MAKRKKIKKQISFHPVVVFIIIALAVVILSSILKLFDFSATYNVLVANTKDFISKTESVTSLLNLRGIKYIFSNTVSNFANYVVLSNLLIVLIGIGVMEYSGFLRTAIGLLTKRASKFVITYTIVLICLLSSVMDFLPFLAFIPLAGLIYKYGKRNPNLGIIVSYASLTCGYGLSFLFTSIDSSLAKISIAGAGVLDESYVFKSSSLVFIMTIAIIIISIIITFITENHIAPKLPKYEFDENEVFDDNILDKLELRGLVLAGLGSAIYLILFIYNIIPGLPLSGNFLNYSQSFYIDKLFGEGSFFASGFVFIITMLFIIWGLLYGIGAKTIKNNKDFVDSLGYSLNGIGKTVVYIFVGSVLISVFKQTNIGNVIVAGFTTFITNSKFSGLPLCLLLFVFSAIATLFVPNSITKWTIMSSGVIPTFLNAGLSAEFAQVIFRFGETSVIGLTPLFAYFIVYLAFLEKYKQGDQNLSLLQSFKYQLPYSLSTMGVLLLLIVIWYLISLPLGIGGYVSI